MVGKAKLIKNFHTLLLPPHSSRESGYEGTVQTVPMRDIALKANFRHVDGVGGNTILPVPIKAI
jgi:hypothetical protein